MKKSKKLRELWYKLPTQQRFLIRRMYYLPADVKDGILGRRHKYVPPRGAIYTGSPASAADYLDQGRGQVALMQNQIELKPTEDVLDIGSGIGRTAIALTEFLNSNGSYEGFDVVLKGVEWCQNRIHRDFANFNFTYVPLFNDLYNNATQKATDFKFPYADASFDKVFSFSVFTHMGVSEIENYLKEVERVLKPGGKCLSTFFIYSENEADYIANREVFGFPVDKGGYKLMHAEVTAGNIAIHEKKLKDMANQSGLKIDKMIDGFWKDEQRDPTKIEYQDVVVFSKQ